MSGGSAEAGETRFRLSICIATHNRATFIGETIDSILSQLSAPVELLVVDGGSTDATAEVVQARFAGQARCRYLRLPEKGGVDQDYCRAVAEAAGEFCWLMTDDDLLLPGAVARVLAELLHEPDLIVVNAEVAGPDLQSVLVPRKLPLRTDRAFGRGEGSALFALAGDLLTFIGAVVVRTRVFRARDPRPFFGSEFAHVGILFAAPLERGARVIAAPLVRIRHGNAQWSARAFEIWMLKWPRLVWSLPGLSDRDRAAVTPRDPWRSGRALLQMKAKGCYSLDEYRRFLAPLPAPPPLRLWMSVLAALPDVPFNVALQLLLPVFFPHAKGTLVDLQQSRFARGRR